MEHHTTTSRAEAERLLGIAEKLLRNKDFSGSRDFAILAQETEPLLEGSDQILAVAEVLSASDNKRPTTTTAAATDWYAVLQIPNRTDDPEVIKKQYRRLALLLHPDKNKFPFADSAFRLVADAWAVLSDPAKKQLYDKEFVARFAKVDLVAATKPKQQKKQQQQPKEQNSSQKLPIRRSERAGASPAAASGGGGVKSSKRASAGTSSEWMGSFWTTCPYCYNLYEYPKAYEGCCVRCDNENCRKAFTAAGILSMPPLVPGREAYYACWGFFPLGFVAGSVEDGGNGSGNGNGFPKWMPNMFGEGGVETEDGGAAAPPPPVTVPPVVPAAQVNVTSVTPPVGDSSGKKKRGRPRKVQVGPV